MPEIHYCRATLEDVQSLTDLRLDFLAEVNGYRPTDDSMRNALRHYFTQSISAGEFVACLAFAESQAIASSGLAFHHHPPSNRNPTGREAYIMNMYTVPEYRRRGIATKLLQMLIDKARESGCGKISLHVLPNGRSIYVKAGFAAIETEMRLNL
jgi:ribosomal protein S18 acetylase RimI-like enzyme